MGDSDTADIDIYGVDHRAEEHARTVAAAIREEQPDYVLREALDRQTYANVREDVILDGQIATPERLATYITEQMDADIDASYLAAVDRDVPLVDLDPETVRRMQEDVAAIDGADAAAERLATYVERMESPNSTETYRVNAAVYDARQAGEDTRVAGMDAQTGASSVSPTMMAKRNRAMADRHAEIVQDGNTHIVSIMGMNHAQGVAQLLEMEGYQTSVIYPETEEALASAESYNAWIASEL